MRRHHGGPAGQRARCSALEGSTLGMVPDHRETLLPAIESAILDVLRRDGGNGRPVWAELGIGPDTRSPASDCCRQPGETASVSQMNLVSVSFFPLHFNGAFNENLVKHETSGGENGSRSWPASVNHNCKVDVGARAEPSNGGRACESRRVSLDKRSGDSTGH